MPDAIAAPSSPVRWGRVAVFYVLACAVSWPVFWLARHAAERPDLPGVVFTLGYMWGPGIAALVLFAWLRGREPRRTTLLGPARRRSLAFYALPMAVLGLACAPYLAVRALLVTFGVGLLGLLTTLGEELGWRGYLQDALRPIPRGWRYLLIGVLWELWHFRFGGVFAGTLTVSEALLREARWLPVLIAASAVIGEATDRTRSVAVAVTLHLWINVVLGHEVEAMFGVPHAPVWGAAAVAAGLWAWMLWRWPAADAPAPAVRSRPAETAPA